jgi:hypothetical protein
MSARNQLEILEKYVEIKLPVHTARIEWHCLFMPPRYSKLKIPQMKTETQ